jgi:hypothetical protein
MKLRFLSIALATVTVGAALYAFQDKKEPPKGQAMETPKPSAEHKALQRAVGNWDAALDMMGQPSKGTMMVESGPGGFTTLTHFKSDMNGAPFEGRGIDGYDVNKKKFVSIWVDSMAASPMLTEGSWDEKSQTMTMFGDAPDMTGKVVKHRLVTKWTDNDHMDFEIFAPGADGKEASMLKIKYARKK